MLGIVRLLTLLLLSYCFYIFPIQMLVKWGFDISVSLPFLFIMVGFISGLLFYYFKTKTKWYGLRVFANWGVGVGFFSAGITYAIVLLDSYFVLKDGWKISMMMFITAGVVSYALYQGSRITIRSLSVVSPKLKQSYTVVFISDVHIGTQSSGYLEMIIHKIELIKPDYVFIGGDLIDSSHVVINDLASFKRLTMPIYFVTGNHEYYLEHSDSLLAQLEDININWVDNTSIDLAGFQLIGVSDQQSKQSKCDVINRYMQSDQFSIAMVHKPSCFDALDVKPDLMLSGHTHNGQIFPFGFLVKLAFPKSYGLYEDALAKLYVSSGVGTWGNRMRLGTVNELVVITLAPR